MFGKKSKPTQPDGDTNQTEILVATPAADETAVIGPEDEPAPENTPAPAGPTVIRRRKRKGPWIFAIIMLLLLALAGAAIWHAVYYTNHALLRSSVGSVSVSGMTRAEAKEAVAKAASATTINITGDAGEHKATLDDLGIKVNSDAAVKELFAANESILNRFNALWTPRTINPKVEADKEKIEEYIQTIIPENVAKAKNAKIILNDDGETFSFESGKRGKTLPVDPIAKAAQDAAASLKTQPLALTYVDQEPEINDEEAKQLVESAEKLTSVPVTVSWDGNQYEPSAATRAEWVNLEPNEDNKLTINEQKIAEWVRSTADENIESTATSGVRKVSVAGEVLEIITNANDGHHVKNHDEVTKNIIAALKDESSYLGEFKVDVEPAVWEDLPVAEGAEYFFYKPAPGENWIDINLSSETITAYNGAVPQIGPVYMKPGGPGYETVTGVFSVYLKYQIQTMRGENLDGSSYEVEDVPWVMYFHGSYAIHGAPWRDSFGPGVGGGSHGCINMPVDMAQALWNWTSMGTTVASHY